LLKFIARIPNHLDRICMDVGEMLISLLGTVFANIWTEFNWIRIGPVMDSC